MKRQILFVFPMVMLGMPAAFAGDADAIMKGCNDCHGDNGVSKWADVPSIGGLPEFVHADALYVFRDGDRPCVESKYRQGDTGRAATDMCAIAGELSDDDIDAVAAAYAELPWVKADQAFDAGLAAKGEKLHADNCDRCHSDAGTNPDDEASMLGGQQMGYLRNAFGQYTEGGREQPAKMKEKLDALSADDLEALVNYYGSIK
jgi:sulfide dehydrogenase cytochrome subunit